MWVRHHRRRGSGCVYQIHLNRVTDLILTACGRVKKKDRRKNATWAQSKSGEFGMEKNFSCAECRLSGGVEIAMKSTRTWLCTFMRTRFRKVIRLWVALPYNLYAVVHARTWVRVSVWVTESVFLAVVFFVFFFFCCRFSLGFLLLSPFFRSYAPAPPHDKWRQRSPFANSIQRNVSTE